MNQRSNQEAKNIGARFRSARSLVPDLNRKSFCERYGINRYTMQSWENGLHVSKGKNVERFIEALARENVFCTSEWLIEGIGDPARPLLKANNAIKTASLTKETGEQNKNPPTAIVEQLIETHKDLEETLLSFTIPDDAMAPKFLMGDVVLARLVTDQQKDQIHQKYCLIELSPDRLILRKVIQTKDSFILLAQDERINSMGLNLSSRMYLVTWHWVNQ